MNSRSPHQSRTFGAPLARGPGDLLDGVLIVDKPPGPTSHDIVEFYELEEVKQTL